MTYYMNNNKPPQMPQRELRSLLIILRNVLRAAKMEDASFGMIGSDNDPTEFIKERTRVYRQSWIVAPLEELIERYSGQE